MFLMADTYVRDQFFLKLETQMVYEGGGLLVLRLGVLLFNHVLLFTILRT